MSIYKEGQKDDPRNNNSLLSLTLVLGKVMEEIILTSIIQHIQDNHGIKPSQHGFMKERPFFSLPFLRYFFSVPSSTPSDQVAFLYRFWGSFSRSERDCEERKWFVTLKDVMMTFYVIFYNAKFLALQKHSTERKIKERTHSEFCWLHWVATN